MRLRLYIHLSTRCKLFLLRLLQTVAIEFNGLTNREKRVETCSSIRNFLLLDIEEQPVAKGKGKVVIGLSPALACWREESMHISNEFSITLSRLCWLYTTSVLCLFTTLPFELMANSDHMFDRRGGEQLTFLIIGYDLVH